MRSRLRLVVLGMMGRFPFAGHAWVYLNWLRGFSALGHEVWYVEDDSVWPYDPIQNTVTDDCSYALCHVSGCLERIGLSRRWAFRLADREGACWGLSSAGLADLYATCDALINLQGGTDLREPHLLAPFRVYVQSDTTTAELRLANGDEHTRRAFADHQVIVTYGENYGAPDCGVPLNGIPYLKTRQPVDLELWPASYTPAASFFTTIGNYRQPGNDVEYCGDVYRWSKHHEWEKVIDLPRHTRQRFDLALALDDDRDRDLLEGHGWGLRPPLAMSLDVFGAYPAFIRESRAEFTVAKDQNVRLRSGWFSDRDACYLATGKPVVAQDTGFANALPTGRGLFAFRSREEALEAIEAVNSDYAAHCMAARQIAEDHFEARAVASRFIRDLGLA
jgi:hypothetical protein